MKVLDRRLSRIRQPWRTILDWSVAIALAVACVLAFKAEVAKPYRISHVVDGADTALRKARRLL